MWVLYALLSALAAGLVAIFGKLGLKGIDSTLATTIRAIIMASFLVIFSVIFGKFADFKPNQWTGRQWLFIALAGIAGAISWLFYFLALQQGMATKVSALDRLSLVFVVVFSALFLGEVLTWKVVGGAALMLLGTLLITW